MDDLYEKILAYVSYAMTAIVVLIAVSVFCGCKQIEYVTVPEVHTEHIYHTDSVHHTDSVLKEKLTIIREARPEDSAMLAQMGIKLADNERLLIMLQKELAETKSELKEYKSDSVAKRDSIPYPVPVKEIVKEKYTPTITKVLAWIGGVVLLALLIWLSVKFIIPLIKRFS